MDRIYYETEFVNKRKGNVHVHENGKILCVVPPGESRFVESFDPKLTSYAKWYRITFKNNGEVKLEENSTWKFPYPGMLMLEALNIDGVETEAIHVAGVYWQCYRGIPRYIPVSINDRDWRFIAKVERREVSEKVKVGDYFETKKTLQWVKTERSKKEITKIKQQLLDEAIEKTKRDVERSFPKPEQAEIEER